MISPPSAEMTRVDHPDEVELVAVVLLGFEGAAQRASEDAEKSIREKMEEVSIMVGSTVASVE